jgi:hypothetical protein
MSSIIIELLAEYGQAIGTAIVGTTIGIIKRHLDLKKIKKEQEIKDEFKK